MTRHREEPFVSVLRAEYAEMVAEDGEGLEHRDFLFRFVVGEIDDRDDWNEVYQALDLAAQQLQQLADKANREWENQLRGRKEDT